MKTGKRKHLNWTTKSENVESKKEEHIQHLWENIKQNNIRIFGAPERELGNEKEKSFEDMTNERHQTTEPQRSGTPTKISIKW